MCIRDRDNYYSDAYKKFDEAHGIYEDLVEIDPNPKFKSNMDYCEQMMGEIQKKKGIGGN